MTDVVCCTLYSSAHQLLKDFNFPFVVVDEASTALEPATLLAFAQTPAKIILVGDHMQLGPILKSEKAKLNQADVSLFERLIKIKNVKSVASTVLNLQYRMVPGLMEYPSNTFYEGVIRAGRKLQPESWIKWPNPDVPVIFANVEGTEESDGKSCQNSGEANSVVELILILLNKGVNEENIGVITPYVKQKSLILSVLRKKGLKNIDVESVNAFQGREKDYIIMTTTRTDSSRITSFLDDPKRLNVSLTRAKLGLWILGDQEFLKNLPNWNNYLKYLKSKTWTLDFGRPRILEKPAELEQLS
eukprot:CAMPEP_0176442670 /NCGR_PEP_ID=MMETSP0127-20121128/21962_1 /TAXON_ID=938130 /ORGANISM="Platyophrya macrostoma, Strain WH" /LENGTH=301 /DNA_ID=CAMNT_0017827745 /DNA_START=179 /DNA_END=1084 /DNA_ORIENTATION=-